jgi:peptidoglycan/xylan/chitin deacetylase (PgdA/CDA1 family)
LADGGKLGTLITSCLVPGTIALTFDDGPWTYTDQMLDVLQSFNVKATFFVVGNNMGKGRMDDASTGWPLIMRRMYAAGHQIASHSWTHQDLTQINSTLQQAQIIYNEMAFRNLFGWFPTYFRAPYLDCTASSGCVSLLNNLGYHIIDMNLDTLDYLFDDPNKIQTSKDIFSNGVSNSSATHSYIPLAHEIHYQTVVNLTAFMIQTLIARGYSPVTVGECLGDPKENWYRDASGTSSTSTTSSSIVSATASSFSSGLAQTSTATFQTFSKSTSTSTSSTLAASSSLAVSTNQLCGGTSGFTCLNSRYGNCCSYYGYW